MSDSTAIEVALNQVRKWAEAPQWSDGLPCSERTRAKAIEPAYLARVKELHRQLLSSATVDLPAELMAQYEEAVEHGQQRAEATHSLQQHTFDEAPLITPMPIPSEFDVEMGVSTLYTASSTHPDSSTQTLKRRVPLVMLPETTRIPSHEMAIRLSRNVEAEDETLLRNIPHIKDDDPERNAFINGMLNIGFEGSHLEEDDVRTYFNGDLTAKAELRDQAIRSSILLSLVDKTAALLGVDQGEGGREKDGPSSSTVHTKAPAREVFYMVATALDAEPEILLKNYLMLKARDQPQLFFTLSDLEWHPDADSPTAKVSDPVKMMDSYHALFCRQCFRYDCHFHSARPTPGLWASRLPGTPPPRAARCSAACGAVADEVGDGNGSAVGEAGAAVERMDGVDGGAAAEEGGGTEREQVVLSSHGVRMSLMDLQERDPSVRCCVCKCPLESAYWKGPDGDTDRLCVSCAEQDPYILFLANLRSPTPGSGSNGCIFKNKGGGCGVRKARGSRFCAFHAGHFGGLYREGAAVDLRGGGKQPDKAAGKSEAREASWSMVDRCLVDKLATYPTLDPCTAARAWPRRSCCEVAPRFRTAQSKRRAPAEGERPPSTVSDAGSTASTASTPAANAANAKRRKVAAKPKAKQKAKTTLAEPGRKMARKIIAAKNAGQEWKAATYRPCTCVGEKCEEGCECFEGNNYCQKYCQCGPTCKNRFQGCRCLGRCETKVCPCVTALRECDPDMCSCCANPEHTKEGAECKNTVMLRGAHAQIAVGQSEVAGWGAFAKHAIAKGDFVCEYKGEIITQEEAERRGNLYDKHKLSFLFNLSTDHVIDATRKGNKARMINHSADSFNCMPLIKNVGGEVRIGLFATEDIPKDTELFFDYGYDKKAAQQFVPIARKPLGRRRKPSTDKS